jgi:hypothetical protein
MTDDRRRTFDRERPTRPESPNERRSSDGAAASEERPLASFGSRLPRVDRSPLVPVIGLSLLVAVAVVTSRVGAPATIVDSPTSTPIAAAAGVSVEPMPSNAADTAVAAICLEPGSWRTATIETWRAQTVHVWRAIDPTAASGPDDPAIPLVPAVGSRIDAIGFCAPVVGPKRPAAGATVEAWRLAEAPVRIELRPLIATDSQSSLGGLYGPPDPADAATGWPAGVVVFSYEQTTDGVAATPTWFGIEIVLTDPSGAEPSPSPVRAEPLVSILSPSP